MSEYIVELNSNAVSGGKFLLGTVYLDAQEIVRCRDCRWISKDTKHYKACYRLPDCEFMVEPDGFCAWAERKVDGE